MILAESLLLVAQKPLAMRRCSHIVVAAFLAAMCVLPAAGQSYKASKVREKSEPEPLEFKRSFTLNGNNKDKGDIYRYLYGWSSGIDMEFVGSVGFDEKCYFLAINGLDFAGKEGRMTCSVNIHILAGGLTLELKDFAIGWDNHFIPDLSKQDDKFNRTWLWRVNHNPEVVQAGRDRCREIFDTLCASLDNYLKEGPPLELQLVN